jgi:predicted adenylyl cyclase CyaB
VSIEIEIKAWADNWESTKHQIDDFAQFLGSYEKSDVYWIVPEKMKSFIPELKSGVRIRKESFKKSNTEENHFTRVCFKKKEIRTDMEVNAEKEFDVTDVTIFEELLSNLGLVRGQTKHKKGFSWNYQNITIELSKVENLGWFCELEIIAEQDDADFVVLSRNRLYEVLQKTGIDAARIESRYYTEMLASKDAGISEMLSPKWYP